MEGVHHVRGVVAQPVSSVLREMRVVRVLRDLARIGHPDGELRGHGAHRVVALPKEIVQRARLQWHLRSVTVSVAGGVNRLSTASSGT